MEMMCIVYFALRFCHEMLLTEFWKFWKDFNHIIHASILSLITFDMLLYTAVIFITGDQQNILATRWTRALRPFILLNFSESRQIRAAFKNISNSCQDIFYVLVLLLCSVGLFSLMAMKLFGPKEITKINGQPYFANFLESCWDLYVLITTANNPDITIPSYKISRWYMLFFIAYLLINLYMFMSVFLAVAYGAYKSNLINEAKHSDMLKKRLLTKVYTLLECPKSGGVKKPMFLQLIKDYSHCQPDQYAEILWQLMMEPKCNGIQKETFLQLVDVITLTVTDIDDQRTVVEICVPRLYNSMPSRMIIKCIKHALFTYIFDAIIIANVFCIALDVKKAESVFLGIFALEILLKVYAYGGVMFIRKKWNVFDLTLTSTATVLSTFQYFRGMQLDSDWTQIILVLRVIRPFKILHHSKLRFRIIINTILRILPSMAIYGVVIFIFYYFFAILGMEIFAGKIWSKSNNVMISDEEEQYCGNIILKESWFYKDHYCDSNFNNIIAAFGTLFELMVVNQWHVIADGHVLVTNRCARIFFLAFHFACVIVILNIYTSFVIEAFLLEYQSHKNCPYSTSPIIQKIHNVGLEFRESEILTKRKIGATLHSITNTSDESSQCNAFSNFEWEAEVESGNKPCADNVTRNALTATSLRFHLRKRKTTTQEILGKMLEQQLKLDHVDNT